MKSRVPWGSGEIDEETREAARAAAEQSGLSLTEWLNQVIAERRGSPARGRTAEPAGSDISDHVDTLIQRLRSMDEASRAAVPGLRPRLDRIENELAALRELRPGSAERARTAGALANLVSRLKHDLDNADENARRMIEGLRDRLSADAGRGSVPGPQSGSVGEAIRELDQRIAAMSERLRPAPAPAPDRLAEVRSQLDALLAKGGQAQTSPGRASLDASLRSLETRIDEARMRLARVSTPAPAGGGRMDHIEAQLADIAELTGADAPTERPHAPAFSPQMPAMPEALSAAIAEISARQQMLDERSDARAEMAGSIASLRREIAALAETVSTVGRSGAEDKSALYDLARRIDALATEKPLDRNLLSAIRTDVEAVRRAIEGGDGRAGMAAQLDSLAERTADRGRLDALGTEVAALRKALESADSPKAFARLEMRLAELGRSVESALNGDSRMRQQGDRESMTRLETTLNEVAARIDGLLDRAPAPDAIAAVHDRIAHLAARLDDIDAFQRGPAAALDEIKAELAALRHELAGRTPPRTDHLEKRIAELVSRFDSQPRNDQLEHRVAELANRLDSVAAGVSDSEGLAELEAQVAYLAMELERVVPRTAALDNVEANLARLQGLLAENRQESVDAARRAAREAVSEIAGDRVNDEIVAALRDDLEAVRGAAGTADLQTRQTLGAVHDTLAKVVERLSRLEAGESLAPAPEEPRATVPRASVSGWMPPSRQGENEDHRPLEPGSGKPDLAALRELAKAATDPQREKRPIDRKADFIAAARRAAQAAAAEAKAAEHSDEPPADPKQGTFARIGQAIRSRRRPLLLAAAAIVLAIGALQIAGDRLTLLIETASGKSTSETAAFVAPPVVDAPAAKAGVPAEPPAARDAGPLVFASQQDFDSRFEAANEDSGVTRPLPGTAYAAETVTASLDGALPAKKAIAPMPDAGIGSTYLRNAAATGDPAAAFEVGVRYAEGHGVPADLAKASEWYTRAAEAGIAVAQYRLGSLYERGQGVPANPTAAIAWYQRAADQGNVGAMHNLAVLLGGGADGTPDPQKALEWFEAAAYHGVKDSQYNLGVIYARGIGVEADMVQAYKWFAVAAAQGDADAASRRDEIGKALSPDQIAAARAAVSSWRAQPARPEANSVMAPEGGWDEPAGLVNEKDQRRLVMTIQQLLAEQGYDPGPADGVAGEKTREAVRAFQKTIGAAATGEISGELVAALGGRG